MALPIVVGGSVDNHTNPGGDPWGLMDGSPVEFLLDTITTPVGDPFESIPIGSFAFNPGTGAIPVLGMLNANLADGDLIGITGMGFIGTGQGLISTGPSLLIVGLFGMFDVELNVPLNVVDPGNVVPAPGPLALMLVGLGLLATRRLRPS